MSDARQTWLRLEAGADGRPQWMAGGDWTIEHYASLLISIWK